MSSTTTIATQEATHYEQVVQQWRDWLHYLRSQQTLVQVRSAAPRSAFEQDDSDVREQRARDDLHAIPPAQRAIFEREFEARQQAMQRDLDAERRAAGGRGTTDPDEVTRRTLEVLLAEAEGVSTADERGMVPVEHDTWYSVDVGELLKAPGDASYAVKGTRSSTSQTLVLGLLLVVGVGALLAWFFWPQEAAPTVVYHYEAAANGQVVTAWEPLQITLGTDPSAPTFALRPVDTFPPANADDTTAAYRPEASWPLAICLPADPLATVQQVRIASALDAPERIYLVTDQRGPVADLVLQACDDPKAPPRYGVVQETPPLATQRVGQATTLPDTRGITVAVQAITILGSASDPTLPRDQARVTVVVASSHAEALDWTALQPRLTIPSGQDLLPAETRPGGAGVQFHYLVPLPPDRLEVCFSLTAATAAQVRWRTPLAPPPGRDALLRQYLAVEGVSATPVATTQAQSVPVDLRIVVVNHADTPLALSPDDIALLHDGSAVPLPVGEALRTPLAAGERRVITLEVALPTTGPPLLLTVGVFRYEVQVAFG